MDFTKELDTLEARWKVAHPLDLLLWKKIGVLREMARRIEALESLLTAIMVNTELIAANTEMARANTEMVNANAEAISTILEVLTTMQEATKVTDAD